MQELKKSQETGEGFGGGIIFWCFVKWEQQVHVWSSDPLTSRIADLSKFLKWATFRRYKPYLYRIIIKTLGNIANL